MIRFLLATALTASTAPAHAQLPPEIVAQLPAPEPTPIAAPAQPGTVSLGATSGRNGETWFRDHGKVVVRNVTHATLTPILPVGPGTGTAVIVSPGGGFLSLAMEKEGWEVARWLANHGVAAFVLKYRLLPTPPEQARYVDEVKRGLQGEAVSFRPPADTPPEALADGRAALRYVRAHAAEYGVDPARIGALGFSAGGMVSRSLISGPVGERPAFVAPIYPPMFAIPVPADAPPMFLMVANDDYLLRGMTGLPLLESYRAAGRPIEFHLLPSGGHGFGVGAPGTSTAGWLDLFLRWMDNQGFMKGGR